MVTMIIFITCTINFHGHSRVTRYFSSGFKKKNLSFRRSLLTCMAVLMSSTSVYISAANKRNIVAQFTDTHEFLNLILGSIPVFSPVV